MTLHAASASLALAGPPARHGGPPARHGGQSDRRERARGGCGWLRGLGDEPLGGKPLVAWLALSTCACATAWTYPNAAHLVSAQLADAMTAAEIWDDLGQLPPLEPYVKHGVRSYRITYATSDEHGEPVVASGALLVPTVPAAPRAPLLGLHHFTIFRESYIPSHFDPEASYVWDEAMAVATAGFVTVVPDYLGHGITRERVHPYHHARTSASSSVDALRAAREFCRSIDLTLADGVFLAGYSEGAYAAIAAYESLEEDPSHEFSVSAVSVAAGAYDMRSQADFLFAQSSLAAPATVASVLLSYDAIYAWHRPLGDFFTPRAVAAIEGGIFSGASEWDEANRRFGYGTSDSLNERFLQDYRGDGEATLKRALDENSVHRWAPRAPVRLYHGDADTVVAVANSQAFYDFARAHGSTQIELHVRPGLDHEAIQEPWRLETLAWFDGLNGAGE